ncbi:MAG: N-6 DNA methylase, partial [Burkholderiaceae bacterium]
MDRSPTLRSRSSHLAGDSGATPSGQSFVEAFIRRWSAGPAQRLKERQGAQSHFLDLCRLLAIDPPVDDDNYCFERGMKGVGGEQRYADVWKRGCFAWEYKAPGGDLDAALRQLIHYALRLDNPPLLIVSDRLRIEIHTHFTGYPSERSLIALEDLRTPGARARLRSALTDPESFRPRRSNADITATLAGTFAQMAERLRNRGVSSQRAAHFLIQCLFCFFAESIGALPDRVFSRTIVTRRTPKSLQTALHNLFTVMKDGGDFGSDAIAYFNGGLYSTVAVPELDDEDLRGLKASANAMWDALDPAILGTLFERGFDPVKRSQLGAHYTDPETIERIVDPVVRQPLLREWEAARSRAAAHLGYRDFAEIRAKGAPSATRKGRAQYAARKAVAKRNYAAAEAEVARFMDRLHGFRVLDPACGSGNFLFLALKALKDLEFQANDEAAMMGLERSFAFMTGPWNLVGIEISEYAAELAKATIWIAELQWMKRHSLAWKDNPVLAPLEQIECRDALLDGNGCEARWPEADAVVSNPPFLGDKRMRSELGDAYCASLRGAYAGRVPGGADLVTYWFQKAGQAIRSGRLKRAGLVATNTIRQGANRKVLAEAVKHASITDAWSDLPWVNEGAAVRVSVVCWGKSDGDRQPVLDGCPVQSIHPDLKGQDAGSSSFDLTMARPLAENGNASFFGLCLAGPFKVPAAMAADWLRQPNPNGRPNSDVLRPIFNGRDVTDRWSEQWVVDFGAEMDESEASLYQAPFEYVRRHVLPVRSANKRAARAKYWWRHGEARPGLRSRLAGLSHYIATVETAKHRVFVRFPIGYAPEHRLVVIPRQDHATLGLLSSRLHTVWALARGGTLEDRPVYNTGAIFEPFPFPIG